MSGGMESRKSLGQTGSPSCPVGQATRGKVPATIFTYCFTCIPFHVFSQSAVLHVLHVEPFLSSLVCAILIHVSLVSLVSWFPSFPAFRSFLLVLWFGFCFAPGSVRLDDYNVDNGDDYYYGLLTTILLTHYCSMKAVFIHY